MKKKALIISNDMFLNYEYDNGNYIIKNNKILSKLKHKVEYDNISSKGINSLMASNYIKEFIKHYNYSYCIISLNNYDDSINNAVEALEENGIKTILVATPNASKEQILKVEKLANNNLVKYVVVDDVLKEQNDNKLNSVILKFCA